MLPKESQIDLAYRQSGVTAFCSVARFTQQKFHEIQHLGGTALGQGFYLFVNAFGYSHRKSPFLTSHECSRYALAYLPGFGKPDAQASEPSNLRMRAFEFGIEFVQRVQIRLGRGNDDVGIGALAVDDASGLG
jgi:hypothetical protein